MQVNLSLKFDNPLIRGKQKRKDSKFNEKCNIRYRPSSHNSTISPYRSSYVAFGVSQSVPSVPWLYVNGGVGYNKADVEKGLNVGTGILTNLGIGVSAGNNFFLEFNTFFVKWMKKITSTRIRLALMNLSSNVMLAYDIVKKGAE